MSDAFQQFKTDVDFMWRMSTNSWGCMMLTSGKLDQQSLAMVTLQMYHYVKQTVPVFEYALGLLADTAENAEMRALLNYFIKDEAGHDLVALRDLKAMGYDPEACRNTLPLPTTMNLQGANKLAIDQYGPFFLLGETYATETVGAQISQGIYDAYQTQPALKKKVSFYQVHGEADIDHAARSEATLRRYLEVEQLRRPLLLGCLTAWKNLTNLGMEIQNYQLYPAEFQLPARRPS